MHQHTRITALLGLSLLALNLHAVETYDWVNDATSGPFPVASFTITDGDYSTAIGTGSFVPIQALTASYTGGWGYTFSLANSASPTPSVSLDTAGNVVAFSAGSPPVIADLALTGGTPIPAGWFMLEQLGWMSQGGGTHWAARGDYIWTDQLNPPPWPITSYADDGTGQWVRRDSGGVPVPDVGAMLAMATLSLAGLSWLGLRKK